MQRLNAWAKSFRSSSEHEIELEEDEELPEFITVTDTLDLHGTKMSIIPEMINACIENAVELKLDRVQIIHGKGKSKLKHLTYQILQDDERVLEFYDAPPQLGGWGRTIVELKSNPGN